jgi:hypothetical protein
MLESRARRIPIVDSDDETRRTMVVSVITQYRILKFIAVNVKETQKLRKPLKELNVGTYEDLATASMDTPVMDVIHMLVRKSISRYGRLTGLCWARLTSTGTVLNVFEAVDVIALIKGGVYDDLSLTVGDALLKRSDVCCPSSVLLTYYSHIVGLPWYLHLLAQRQHVNDLRHDPQIPRTSLRCDRRREQAEGCGNSERRSRAYPVRRHG